MGTHPLGRHDIDTTATLMYDLAAVPTAA